MIRVPPTTAHERRERLDREGFCVIEGAFDASTLAMLREECALAIAWQEEAIARNDASVETLNRMGERYFIPRRSSERARLREFVLGAPMGALVGPLLGSEAYLFIDVFVEKAPRSDNSFGWHQDHGYVDHYGFGRFAASTTFWVALDDVDDANGALHVVPFSAGAKRELAPHRLDPATKDCVMDVDDRLAECISMKAGGLLVMSGLLPHRSGPNRTDRRRSAYQWQYSPSPIVDDGKPISLAAPFLSGGAWVGSPAPSPAPNVEGERR